MEKSGGETRGHAARCPLTIQMSRTTSAMISSTCRKPPKVYDAIKPRNHKNRRITKTSQSIPLSAGEDVREGPPVQRGTLPDLENKLATRGPWKTGFWFAGAERANSGRGTQLQAGPFAGTCA